MAWSLQLCINVPQDEGVHQGLVGKQVHGWAPLAGLDVNAAVMLCGWWPLQH